MIHISYYTSQFLFVRDNYILTPVAPFTNML